MTEAKEDSRLRACPSADRLSQYLAGGGDEVLEAHLEDCPRCRGIVSVVEASCSQNEVLGQDLFASPWIGSAERYELLRPCGKGGQSSVYAAYDRQLEREVAFKEFKAREDSKDRMGWSSGVARFLREASVASSLEHPNLAPVYELGVQADGTPFFTMRLIRGQTLATAVREAASLQGRIALLGHLLDVCNAVAYAHGRGFIHRDIKPENIMVGAFGEAVLLDWGLAKQIGEDEHEDIQSSQGTGEQLGSRETLVGTRVGTPAYMSPEQAKGDVSAHEARTDVWGLGAVLYFVLSGDTPFSHSDPSQIVADLEDGKRPQLPVELANAVGREMVAIVDRALHPDPACRYTDALAFAADLRAYIAGGLVTAHE